MAKKSRILQNVKESMTALEKFNAKEMKQKIDDLEAQLESKTNEVQILRKLDKAKVPPPTWAKPSKSSTLDTLVPILFTSDFHVGETIQAGELDGINEYNQAIFQTRYQAMIDKTINLATNYQGGATFPGIYYLRGGDAISGQIHEELLATNDLASIPALRVAFQAEREGIKRLAKQFGRVHVVSIPGNHGRITRKPHSGGYVDQSLESLLAWWLQTTFEDDPSISFQQPDSGDAAFQVLGWRFLLSHGDRMGSRGGQGFIGPAATIIRGHWKLYDNWSRTGQPVDFILTGHLHTNLRLERGYANGSLAGYSAFARDIRALPDAAKQWLLFVHADMGVCDARELILSKLPSRQVESGPRWAGLAEAA